MLEGLIAAVAVEKSTIQFDRLFSYKVPHDLAETLQAGCRVLVPFGGGKGHRQGLVLSMEKGETGDLKEIYRQLDFSPLLDKEEILLTEWLQEHTFCTYFDAARLMIPLGMSFVSDPHYHAVPGAEMGLKEEELALFAFIAKKKRGVGEKAIEKAGFSLKLLSNLVKQGFLTLGEEYRRRIQDETVLFVERTGKEVPLGAALTGKQRDILSFLEEMERPSLKELLYFTGVSRAVPDALVKKGYLRYQEILDYRIPYGEMEMSNNQEEICFNQEQEDAFQTLHGLLCKDKPEAALLYGVTGSGKTQVYLRLIEETLKENKQAILLIPEIALTPQAVRQVKGKFGDKVAVLHSRLSLGERLDAYQRIQNGMAEIAVGTRSAIFAPFSRLGLIILDEEQEYTYKSEKSPRYHARDVAKFRSRYHNALLVLASATPSVESFALAKRGDYHLVTLPSRFGRAQLPAVYVVDMNDEKIPGESTVFSQPLLEGIGSVLSRGEQGILLLNRRGYETVLLCGNCNQVLLCPQCSIALTYHRANGRLLCHCCGLSLSEPEHCPQCGKGPLLHRGLGTQKAEEQLNQIFPDARVLRMDLDTTLTKYAHEEKLTAFSKGEYDLMIGTQMVAKGLDFPNVTLVGVLLADQTLYSNDFRAYEKAFSLLTQVVGRSGRGEKAGSAFIQTYTPYNDIVTLAADQDYEAFFEEELPVRKAMIYPPYAAFVVVGFSAGSEHRAKEASLAFLEVLKGCLLARGKGVPARVLGPSGAGVLKAAGKYRYKLVVKCVNHKETRECLREAVALYSKKPAARQVSTFLDMNYYGSL